MTVDIPVPRAPLLPLCPDFVQFTDCSRLVTAKLESVPQLQGEAEQEMVRGVPAPGYLHIYTSPDPGVAHVAPSCQPHRRENHTVCRILPGQGNNNISLRRSWISIHELILIPLARCSDLQP